MSGNTQPLNILVACEMSGRVRDAMRRRGHNAYSCDLMHSRAGHPHLHGPIQPHLELPWDMLIAFPPCTYLTRAAAWRWKDTPVEIAASAQLVALLANQEHIPMIAIENPHGLLNKLYRYPDQVVQPYWFGDPWTKATCLWLKNLPKLEPTRRVDPTGQWLRMNCPGSRQRSIRRSLTPLGLASAMATQWTPDLSQELSTTATYPQHQTAS